MRSSQILQAIFKSLLQRQQNRADKYSVMTKKKNSSAADDLLDSLMEDLKMDESDLNIGHSISTLSGQEDSEDSIEGILIPDFKSSSKNSHPFGLSTESGQISDSPQVSEASRVQSIQGLLPDLPKDDSLVKMSSEKLESLPEYKISSQSSVSPIYDYISDNSKDIAYEYLEPAPTYQSDYKNLISEKKSEGHRLSENADKTYAIDSSESKKMSSQQMSSDSEVDETIAVTAFAHKKRTEDRSAAIEEKVVIGSFRPPSKMGSGQVFTAIDASLAQAESLKLAQQRILQLEKDLERVRQENEELSSAADVIKNRADELETKLGSVEREKQDIHDQAQSEILILKGNLQYKDAELAKFRLKVDELDSRLKSDFRKIRNKERELENRLELARAEKQALLRTKDETILDLQRKMDQMRSELDNYRQKVGELNRSMDQQNEQIRRTVRALRLALTSLDSQGEQLTPIKKAE